MAVLSENARAELHAAFMREGDLLTETYGAMTKADLRAAVNAVDQFMEDNKGAMNNAIPLPARSEMTTKQKALLYVYVLQRRYLDGS
jgi:hypothetical protein